jgi:hypothetical protein
MLKKNLQPLPNDKYSLPGPPVLPFMSFQPDDSHSSKFTPHKYNYNVQNNLKPIPVLKQWKSKAKNPEWEYPEVPFGDMKEESVAKSLDP